MKDCAAIFGCKVVYDKKRPTKLSPFLFSCRYLASHLFDVSGQSTIEQVSLKEEITIPWGKGIVGHVAESGKSVNIPDCYKVSVCLFVYFCVYCVFVFVTKSILPNQRVVSSAKREKRSRLTTETIEPIERAQQSQLCQSGVSLLTGLSSLID